MRYPQNVTPLIVVGRQRSGTRFLAGALNRFPEIAVQGELPNPVMETAARFIDDVDAYYARNAAKVGGRREKEYQCWLEKKEELIFSIWANASQTLAERPGKTCRYFGYKRPNNEFYFSFYEKHFQDHKPVYIYCCRNFVDNYLSIAARWPERKIRHVAKDYLESIRQYRRMQQSAPERVLTFVLDRYRDEGVEYLWHNVIDRLGVEASQEILAAIGDMKPRNTTEDHGLTRRKELTRSEERYYNRHRELQEEFENLLA